MRMDRLTSKLQEAIAEAQSLAVGKDHSVIEPVHLVFKLIEQKGGSIKPLLAQAGFDLHKLRLGMEQLLSGLPSVQHPDGEDSRVPAVPS